jgi:AcrR family transcriptional regulator
MTNDDEHSSQPGRPSASARRRLLVVDAFIDVVLEGGAPPAPEDVADRAGVSRATFFRYFSTLAELRNDASTRVLERYPELYTLPAVDDGSLDLRVRRFVDARVQLHEVLHPLELLLRVHAAHEAEASAFVEVARQVLADQVRQFFAAELQAHSAARRDDIVTTIAVMTSVESWQQFRHSHHRTTIQTRRAWRIALADVLAAPH